MAREIEKEELEEYFRERQEWESILQEGRIRRHQRASGSGSSLPPRRRGGGGILCVYPDCNREAIRSCEQCYLPYCQVHIPPEKHHCIGSRIREVLTQVNKKRVIDLGKDLVHDFILEKPVRLLSKDEVVSILSKVLPIYSGYCRDFLKIVSTETLIRFIIARLVLKMIEYAQKYGNLIVMDYQLYEQISSDFPPHTPFVAGMAFQWWLTLEILDSIQSELGYNLKWVNLYDRIAEISRGYKLSKRALLLFDSMRVQMDVGARPDILSSRGITTMRDGRVVEIKLSREALETRADQIRHYCSIWGDNNVLVVIGMSLGGLAIMPCKYLDGLLFLQGDSLKKAVLNVSHFLEPKGQDY